MSDEKQRSVARLRPQLMNLVAARADTHSFTVAALSEVNTWRLFAGLVGRCLTVAVLNWRGARRHCSLMVAVLIGLVRLCGRHRPGRCRPVSSPARCR